VSGYLVGTSSDIRLGGFQIGGWSLPFYVFGLIGILWTPFFLATIYSSPEEHPTISKEELQLIRRKGQSLLLLSLQT
jgi:predicted MFS family arabinose efflux permease